MFSKRFASLHLQQLCQRNLNCGLFKREIQIFWPRLWKFESSWNNIFIQNVVQINRCNEKKHIAEELEPGLMVGLSGQFMSVIETRSSFCPCMNSASSSFKQNMSGSPSTSKK